MITRTSCLHSLVWIWERVGGVGKDFKKCTCLFVMIFFKLIFFYNPAMQVVFASLCEHFYLRHLVWGRSFTADTRCCQAKVNQSSREGGGCGDRLETMCENQHKFWDLTLSGWSIAPSLTSSFTIFFSLPRLPPPPHSHTFLYSKRRFQSLLTLYIPTGDISPIVFISDTCKLQNVIKIFFCNESHKIPSIKPQASGRNSDPIPYRSIRSAIWEWKTVDKSPLHKFILHSQKFSFTKLGTRPEV